MTFTNPEILPPFRLSGAQAGIGYGEAEALRPARTVCIRGTARLEESRVAKALLTRIEDEPLSTPEPEEFALRFGGETRLVSPSG